jgi:hypothetical protein
MTDTAFTLRDGMASMVLDGGGPWAVCETFRSSAKYKFQGAFGVWEMCVRREHHDLFTLEVFPYVPFCNPLSW